MRVKAKHVYNFPCEGWGGWRRFSRETESLLMALMLSNLIIKSTFGLEGEVCWLKREYYGRDSTRNDREFVILGSVFFKDAVHDIEVRVTVSRRRSKYLQGLERATWFPHESDMVALYNLIMSKNVEYTSCAEYGNNLLARYVDGVHYDSMMGYVERRKLVL